MKDVENILLLINIVSTLYMTGLIWVIQMVNYRLYKFIGRDFFKQYHQQHVLWITTVGGIPMIFEAFSTVLMLWFPHHLMTANERLWGVLLVFIIWLSTLFFQVPSHGKLEKGFSEKTYLFLLWSNWIRTVSWTLRSLLIILILVRMVSKT